MKKAFAEFNFFDELPRRLLLLPMLIYRNILKMLPHLEHLDSV